MKKNSITNNHPPRISLLILFVVTVITTIFIVQANKSQNSQDTRSSAASAGVGEECSGSDSECIATGTDYLKDGTTCTSSLGEGKIKSGKCAGDKFIKCCDSNIKNPPDHAKDKECIDIGGVCQDNAKSGNQCTINGGGGIYTKGRCSGGSTRLCCVPECKRYALTFYTSLPSENGGNTEMANGDKIATAKNVVASNVYPFGTKIVLDGTDISNFGNNIKYVKDTGGPSFDNPCRLDVLIPSKSGEADSAYLSRVNNLGRPIVDGHIEF